MTRNGRYAVVLLWFYDTVSGQSCQCGRMMKKHTHLLCQSCSDWSIDFFVAGEVIHERIQRLHKPVRGRQRSVSAQGRLSSRIVR